MLESIVEELRRKNISEDKIKEIYDSYKIAADIHKDQVRQSGEPYIIHPLNVAKNLIDMEIYDPDMISAALLHDTIEDAKIDFTKEDIADAINPEVAELVDGVTKISRMEFSTKEEQNDANLRKMVTGLTKDVRILQIKLADRLHNMRTLQFKSPIKQRENALETMNVYVPLALSIGAYKIKSELEDLALQYIEPDEYKRILENRDRLEEKRKPLIMDVKDNLESILSSQEIPNDIIFRRSNINTIHNKINHGYSMDYMYDLFYLKILVDNNADCYNTLRWVHENYRPINGRFRDYIGNQRTNFYQSLHTTVGLHPTTSNTGIYIPNSRIVTLDEIPEFGKIKIRTRDMDKVAAFGVSAYRNLSNPKTQEEIQEEIRTHNQFAVLLKEIDNMSANKDAAFVKLAKQLLLTGHVYVYPPEGFPIELPEGSTAVDYLCQMYPYLLQAISGVVINGRVMPVNTILKDRDRIQIITEGEKDQNSWMDGARTPQAKVLTKNIRDRQNP